MIPLDRVETSRRTFLALCLATAAAATLPSAVRLDALRAYAQVNFAFTPAERLVLASAADTVVPPATIQTRSGARAIPGAGQSGTALFIENLLTSAMIFAAGTQRPDYAMPAATHAPVFPATGQLPMWAVKRIGWFGDGPRPPHRPGAWPSELARLQVLYRTGVAGLNAAVQPAFATFDAAPQVAREAVLRKLQQDETNAYNGAGEGNQPFFLTFLDHVAQACFGDPVYGGNGGNMPAGHPWRWIYWKMVGFNGPSYTAFAGPAPHNGWTAAEMNAPFQPTIPFLTVALPEVEILIVGSGAGGGVAAWVLAEAGYQVLVLEKGPWLDERSFSNDDVKFGYRDFYTQDTLIEPRTFRVDPFRQAEVNHVSPLSRCVGGGSLHYGAASFRFIPDQFHAASKYGVPPGSTLADWPMTYDELEPHYAAVEHGVVIAGIAPGFPGVQHTALGGTIPPNPLAGQFGLHYSQQYPVPPVDQRYDAQAFAKGAAAVGLHPYPTPCAVNTVEGFEGRHACVNCGFCNGWGCPNGAKSSTLVSVLRKAIATGRCEVRAECAVQQVVLDSRGLAKSVLYLDRDFNMVEQPARVIVMACSTIDTPRLAMLSGLDKHDASGMIGHNLTTHHAPSAVVNRTDGQTWDVYRGVWNTMSLDDLQDLETYSQTQGGSLPGGISYPRGGVISMVGDSPGYPAGTGGPISLAVTLMKPPGFYQGGGNAFSPTGLWGSGGIPGGSSLLQAMAEGYNTQAYVLGVCEDLPQHGNMVDLDPTVKDVYGQAVARVTYQNHPNDIAVGLFVASQLPRLGQAMLNAVGASGFTVPVPTPVTSYSVAPRYNVHQHGTMRMGRDPGSSVVNRCGQFWEIPNLFVADGSLMPTSGGYNPTHTIEALAHWVASCIADNGANLLTHPTNLFPVGGGGGTPNTSTGRPSSVAVVVSTAAGAAALAASRRRKRAPQSTSGDDLA